MEKNPLFDDIRPYYDDEVAPVIERLLQNQAFVQRLSFIYPAEEIPNIIATMKSCNNKHDFQFRLSKNVVTGITKRKETAVNIEGMSKIGKDESCTYISNHRDIILDVSLLSSYLANNGYDTPEIAIGDNLLVAPWIEDLVRLNKSFIVKRGVSIRQMLEVSRHLSEYIHFAINEKKQSVWIAQREGRAKDSNDRTQESVLKMLAMGSDKPFIESLAELNIMPVAFSYEYDPCDYLKAKEFQQKRDNPDFKKSQRDDLENMEIGLLGYQRNINIQFGNRINPYLKKLDENMPKNELVKETAKLIDREIFLNYRFFPFNYIAFKRLWGGNFDGKYTSDDERRFDEYLQKKIDKINLPNKDVPYLTERMLEMYANPLKNHLEALSES